MRGEALQTRGRRRHAFATEAIERPYEQEVELESYRAGWWSGLRPVVLVNPVA